MTEAQKNELRALLVRGATLEAQRQDAIRAGDRAKAEGIERELQQLWHQHQELERQVA